MSISQEDLAYMAGLFDGEGWFSLNRSCRKDIRRDFSFQVQACLSIKQKEIVEWIQERFGGSISCHKGRKANHSNSYRWAISGENVKIFVELVFSFLKVKKRQAKLALYFQNLKNCQGNRPLSDDVYNEYLWCKEVLTRLNQRGPNSGLSKREVQEFKKKLGVE